MQQCKEDLLLVAIDTQHHDSHHQTVLASEIWVLWKQGNLFVLETSQYPSGFDYEEVTLFEHPSSSHTFSRLHLPHVDEIKNQDLYSRCVASATCFILVLLELMLLFVHGISFWLLFLLPFRQWPYSVPTYPGSADNDLCAHDIMVKLHMSCCFSFSVMTKQNDPVAAAYLCVSGVIVQCSSFIRT